MKNILTVCIVLFHFGNLKAQDECHDVLIAAYNRLQISQTKSASSAAKSWFCSDHFLSDIRRYSNSTSIGIPLFGDMVSFDANNTSQTSLTKRDKFCASSSNFFSDDEAMSIFSQVVEKRTIEAWENCMLEKIKSKGSTSIYLDQQVTGNDIFLTAKFRVTSNELRNRHPLVVTTYLTNATFVKGEWNKGAEVTFDGILQQLRRINENEPVTVRLVTTQGLSETLTIKGKEYPNEIGYISASWEEPYQAEGASQDMWIFRNTGDHHCENDCQGEPTRTNYNVSLDIQNVSNGDGYLKDPKLECIAGPCGGWNEVKRVEILSFKTAFASWDVWSRPTQWKLSAKWIPYITNYKSNNATRQTLNRGNQVTVYIPKNSRSARIFGRTLSGTFDFPINGIGEDEWLKYQSYSGNGSYIAIKFKVMNFPQ